MWQGAGVNFPGSSEGEKGQPGEGILGAYHRTPRRAPFISISMTERHLVLISAIDGYFPSKYMIKPMKYWTP